MKHGVIALSLVAASVFALPAAAQTKQEQIYVSAVDSKGAPVAGLTADDFAVREDGVAREILKVAPATAPLQIAVLIDNSQAATRAIQMMREGLRQFVKTLQGKAEISLITFGERPTILVGYTTDAARLDKGIDHLFARNGSGAYFLDAVVEASDGLAKRGADRPVIVAVLTEGIEFSTVYYQRVLDVLDTSHAAFHVLTISGSATGVSAPPTNDEVRNRELAVAQGTQQTGGEREQIIALTAIADRLQRLADDLTHQYVLTYARPETLIPPEKVEVTAKRPGLKVRARTRAAGRS